MQEALAKAAYVLSRYLGISTEDMLWGCGFALAILFGAAYFKGRKR